MVGVLLYTDNFRRSPNQCLQFGREHLPSQVATMFQVSHPGNVLCRCSEKL